MAWVAVLHIVAIHIVAIHIVAIMLCMDRGGACLSGGEAVTMPNHANFRYLPVSEREEQWGLYVTGGGFNVSAHQSHHRFRCGIG